MGLGWEGADNECRLEWLEWVTNKRMPATRERMACSSLVAA
jgi:hypothetical protein